MRRCSPSALAAILFFAATIASGAPVETAQDSRIVSRIKRVPVESKAFVAVGYSKRLRALELEFRNGAIYRYLDVPRSVHKGLMRAPSKARFYHQQIRGKYRVLHVRSRAR
jgi:hypothetical protein